ncbi:putative oxidoreductase [Rhizomicrobium palustre]|uniref:Putative oxidoreductase n=1 Tax=Rhizomicrobium palustre TaxID=189966 RepID=A0A846N005_9PROT|nr:DoxX family protein [Rhizomicrobium palustre]NIK88829.1 putative oxidoreductase [Rhizomicrobium palustre]
MADDLGKLFLRLGLGGLLLFHGVHKLLTGLDPVKSLLSAHGLPENLAYIAYFGEILGPLMVLTGVFTRLGAFFIFAEIAALIGLSGLSQLLAFSPEGAYGLETEMLFIITALSLLFTGGGRLGFTRGALS